MTETKDPEIGHRKQYDGLDTTEGRVEEILTNLVTGATAATATTRCNDG